MPTHDPDKTKKPQDQGPGYDTTDANVRDTAAFLIALCVAIAVIFVLAFGIGKLINQELAREDGPTNKWSQMAGVKPENMVPDSRMEQEELRQLVKKFPTPRLQTDDGSLDVADMHAREDILLDHYSWVDEKKQAVRIPITRAMQLLAQRGLPVEAPQANEEQAMFGDGSKAVTAPLTDGFARTGPELRMIEARKQRMELGIQSNTRAEVPPAH